ncbi:MAG TPA: hypothetical protein DCZ13_07635 [Porticoccaceae bacterium]|nr:hypothetical protein [Porticoccaceae bacterium]
MVQRNHVARLLAALFAMLLPGLSWAIVKIGDDIELEGFVKAYNIVRTGASFLDDADLTHQRNTAQVEGKYYFLQEGEAFGFKTGPLEEATFTFLARGVYDSAFDIKDSFDVLDDRGKEEYKVREAFFDFIMPPFSLRLGRQQVVWGETDNFRALDIINPLDRSWHGTRESWEDIRIPLWMARGIWDIGKIGTLDESFLEIILIPDDFQANKVPTDYPRPWAFTGIGLPVPANTVDIGGTLYDLDLTLIDSPPERSELRNMQSGIRFKGIWNDIDFSFNYFYGFSQTPGVRTLSAGIANPTTFATTAEIVYPRINVFGMTANYSEDRYTQSVFRLETTVTKGIPVGIEPGAPINIDPDGDGFDTVDQSVVMLAIDRPTWIKPLNRLRTFFLSTQFFWRRYLDHSSHFRGSFYEVSEAPGAPGRYLSVNNDKLDQDEFVITFSASTSYGGAGLWKPLFVLAYDPRSTGGYTKLQMEYLYSRNLVFKLEQHLYWRESGDDQGPWGLGSYLAEPPYRRNETAFTVTFQF